MASAISLSTVRGGKAASQGSGGGRFGCGDVDIGARFGRLVVCDEVEPYIWRGRVARRRWGCVCDCGRKAVVRDDCLRYGRTTSCGCVRNELSRERATRHGHRANGEHSAEYSVWQAMLHHQPGAPVCRRWSRLCRDGFANFLEDLGPKPSPRHRLVRIDARRGFSPANCLWSEGVRRGVPRRIVNFGGRQYTLRSLAERHGVAYELLCRRLQRGWPIERAVQG